MKLTIEMAEDDFSAGIVPVLPGSAIPVPSLPLHLPPPIQALVAAIAASGTSSPYVQQIAVLLAGQGLPPPTPLPALTSVRFRETDSMAGRGPRPDGLAQSSPTP